MSDDQANTSGSGLAIIGMDAQLSLGELKEFGVAGLRKKTTVALSRAKKALKVNRKSFSDKAKELEGACSAIADGYLDSELKSSAIALSKVFGVELEYKVEAVNGSISEKDNTFKVSVTIGFPDGASGVSTCYGSEAGFRQSLSSTSRMDLDEKAMAIMAEMDVIEEECETMARQIREFEDFLDRGIQVIEDDFTAKVVSKKLEAIEDGDKILALVGELLVDEDAEELVPPEVLAAMRATGQTALPDNSTSKGE